MWEEREIEPFKDMDAAIKYVRKIFPDYEQVAPGIYKPKEYEDVFGTWHSL